jgi:Nucleotidyl transferase AbiEii toxin, Type IV TA system
MELEEVLRILASLEKEGVEYAVFGAVAMNLHGLLRATEDLDLFLAPDEANIERLKRALRAVWDDPSIEEIDARELVGDYPAVRYFPAGSPLYLDILTRLGEAFSWSDLEVQTLEVAGTRVHVISPRTLVRMKANTVRPKDRQDAQWLSEVFQIREEP